MIPDSEFPQRRPRWGGGGSVSPNRNANALVDSVDIGIARGRVGNHARKSAGLARFESRQKLAKHADNELRVFPDTLSAKPRADAIVCRTPQTLGRIFARSYMLIMLIRHGPTQTSNFNLSPF